MGDTPNERQCSTNVPPLARLKVNTPPFGGVQSDTIRPKRWMLGCTIVRKVQRISVLFQNDPQTGVALGWDPRAAMCVQSVDVHVSCSLHGDAQFAASFIDLRAE